MDGFGVLALAGGLALFLFGMDMMGKSLERQAGKRLQAVLESGRRTRRRAFWWDWRRRR